MRLRQSRLASADLDNIYEYGATNYGMEAALAYLDEFDRCFRRLLDHPRSGRIEDGIMAGLRSMSCRSHRIFYRIDGDLVTIERIRHKAADVENWLG